MLKKLALVFLWFFTVPLLIISSVFLIRQKNLDNKSASLAQTLNIPSGVSLEVKDNHLEGQVLGVEIADMRPYLVENFLKNTPLEPYAQFMVEASDEHNLDYRLLPAIAMKETGGGISAREASFNAWGFENGRTNFDSWENAVTVVAKTLKRQYIDKGLTTPEQIMAVYAPPQLLTGGQWAKDINFFFSKLESL